MYMYLYIKQVKNKIKSSIYIYLTHLLKDKCDKCSDCVSLATLFRHHYLDTFFFNFLNCIIVFWHRPRLFVFRCIDVYCHLLVIFNVVDAFVMINTLSPTTYYCVCTIAWLPICLFITPPRNLGGVIFS